MENNKIFLSYLEQLQGEIFTIAIENKIDFIKFVKEFMKSEIAELLDSTYSNIQTRSPYSIYSMFLEKHPELNQTCKEEYNIEAARWLGWFYRKWNHITNESSRRIVGMLSPSDGMKNYFNLHQISEDNAVEICKREYNLKRNAHRAYEYKNVSFDELQKMINDYTKEVFTKTIISKLEGMYLINDLIKEASNESYYDLINRDYKYGLVIRFVNSFSKEELIKTFDIENEELKYSKRTADKSILFLIINSENIYGLDAILDEFKNAFYQTRSKFNYIYIFVYNTIYIIDKVYGVINYSVGTTLRKMHKVASIDAKK